MRQLRRGEEIAWGRKRRGTVQDACLLVYIALGHSCERLTCVEAQRETKPSGAVAQSGASRRWRGRAEDSEAVLKLCPEHVGVTTPALDGHVPVLADSLRAAVARLGMGLPDDTD